MAVITLWKNPRDTDPVYTEEGAPFPDGGHPVEQSDYYDELVHTGVLLTRDPGTTNDTTPETGSVGAAVGPDTVITVDVGAGVEIAYMNFAFTDQYAGSTIDLATGAYSLVRSGGWPTGSTVEVVDPQIGRNLSPTESPTGWWVLDPQRRTTDQSGNSHTLSVGAATNANGPDLGMVSSTLLNLTEAHAVWRTAGAVSCVCLINMNGSTGDRWVASCELVGGFNTWWKFGVGSDGRPCYGVNNLSASEFYQWGTAVSTTGWHVFGWTRAANGKTVKFYNDGQLSASGVATMTPQGHANATLTIGKDLFLPTQNYLQQCTALWVGTELTAVQMARIARRLLGV